MVQNSQEYRLKYWATRSSVRSFARSLTSLTPSLVGQWMIKWPFCLCFFLFSTIVSGWDWPFVVAIGLDDANAPRVGSLAFWATEKVLDLILFLVVKSATQIPQFAQLFLLWVVGGYGGGGGGCCCCCCCCCCCGLTDGGVLVLRFCGPHKKSDRVHDPSSEFGMITMNGIGISIKMLCVSASFSKMVYSSARMYLCARVRPSLLRKNRRLQQFELGWTMCMCMDSQDAFSHFYNRVCSFICPSIHPSHMR